METYGLRHVLIAAFGAIAGSVSFHQALGIWRARNGGNLTRAVVAQLASFGAWAYIIFGECVYEWHIHMQVSSVAQNGADVARLVLSIPQAVLLFVVLPKSLKGH